MLALAVVGLLILLLIGLPIFAALGGVSMVLLLSHGAPPVSIAQTVIDKLNSQTFMAIPFFVIAAQFMHQGGIAKALIGISESWIGRVRGGLALTCIGATCIFSAVSGSSAATSIAMATILIPAMLERGYPRPLAVGVVGSSGTLGMLIPPSILMVVYGIIAEVSIPRLFLAGVIPGLLQAGLFALFVLYFGWRKGLPRSESITWSEFGKANLTALPALLIPTVIFVGIYGGIATVTEAAALAALLAIFVGLFVYKGITYADIIPIAGVALRRTAMIFMIILGAVLFGHWLTETRIPLKLVGYAAEIDLKAWQFLLIASAVMLVLGMFLEGLSIVLILVPIVLPLFQQLGIDPVHFCIIVVINIEMAMLTPPVGLNLFVLSGVSKAPVPEVIRGVLPFMLLMLLLLAFLIFFPGISVWLPNYVYG